MNEFYRPDRHTNPQMTEKTNTETAYAEPENIRIVVDTDTPPRYTENTRQGSIPSPAPTQNEPLPVVIDFAGFAEKHKERLMEEFNPGAGGFNPRLKSKNVSILLCALFGLFGAHRFYEGKIATGILWVCTGGLGLIGWLVDLIILINKPRYYEP